MAITSTAYTIAFALVFALAPKPRFPRATSVMDKRALSANYNFKSVIMESKGEDELEEELKGGANLEIQGFDKDYVKDAKLFKVNL